MTPLADAPRPSNLETAALSAASSERTSISDDPKTGKPPASAWHVRHDVVSPDPLYLLRFVWAFAFPISFA